MVKMAIVSVDTQRRIYLPKELDFKAKKAIIVPRGETYVIIPVPDDVTPIDVNATIDELKLRAEAKAIKEAKDANRV
jgi:virulence-associated protein VagC